jgi:hypothetical protein
MAGIKEKALKSVGGTAVRRAQGDRPGAMKAFAGATVAGAAASVLVYKLLRGGGD